MSTQVFWGVSPGPNGDDVVQMGTVEIGFAERMAMEHGLSLETARACKMGAFEIQDLVPHLPTLRPLIERFGERDVVMLCQDARGIAGSSDAAIDLVVRFFGHAA